MTNLSITANDMTTSTSNSETSAAQTSTAQKLRLVLRANAATSAISGTVGLIGASYWSTKLGVDNIAVTAAVAVGLLVFAVDVVLASRVADEKLPASALLISIADITWVAATAVVVALGLLTPFGTVAAIVIALGVADFAAVQLWLRRRL
jgi:hypothetical protein